MIVLFCFVPSFDSCDSLFLVVTLILLLLFFFSHSWHVLLLFSFLFFCTDCSLDLTFFLFLPIREIEKKNSSHRIMSEPNFKPVTVDKPIPNTYDLGNLATFDPNPLDNDKLKDSAQREEHLASVTRDNLQLLINQVLSLPVKTTTDTHGLSTGQNSTMTLIQLPEPTTALPREKAVPKPKPPTKWEQFAARKGIKAKAKDGKMVYDEATGEWVPKWGYKGKNKELDNQWLVEVDDKVKNTEDELIDPRQLARAERKKLIKKNLAQQKRNLQNNL